MKGLQTDGERQNRVHFLSGVFAGFLGGVGVTRLVALLW